MSVGRDGASPLARSDEAIVAEVLDDLRRHLGVAFTPLEVRVTRWPGAFAQYRPHHQAWVTAIEAALPAGLFVAGSSYRGIGIPACVRDGRSTARRVVDHLDGVSGACCQTVPVDVGTDEASGSAGGAGRRDRIRRYGLAAAVAVLVAGGIGVTWAFAGGDPSTSATAGHRLGSPDHGTTDHHATDRHATVDHDRADHQHLDDRNDDRNDD